MSELIFFLFIRYLFIYFSCRIFGLSIKMFSVVILRVCAKGFDNIQVLLWLDQDINYKHLVLIDTFSILWRVRNQIGVL